jgi:hypothetical protein
MVSAVFETHRANSIWHYEDPSSVCAIIVVVLSFWLRISTSSHFQIILFLGIQQRHSVKV